MPADGERWVGDTPLSTRFPLYTRANAEEVLPGLLTPLGGSFVWYPTVLEAARDAWIEQGGFDAAEIGGALNPINATIYGRLYNNLSFMRVYGVRIGIGAEAMDQAFFAGPDTPPYEPHPDDVKEGLGPRLASAAEWALSIENWPELEEDTELAARARAGRPDLDAMSPHELLAHARSFMPLVYRTFGRHTRGSQTATMMTSMVAATVEPFDSTLSMRLISAPGDLASAAPTYAIYELSRLVRRSPTLSAAFDRLEAGEVDALTQPGDADVEEFLRGLAVFLERFGSRGVSEWDIGATTWETAPSLVYALVASARRGSDADMPSLRHRARETDRREALTQALALLDDDASRGALERTVRSALFLLRAREQSKANCVRIVHEIRLAVRALGARAADAGEIDEAAHVFLLVESELDAFVEHPAAYRDLLAERAGEFGELQRMQVPFIVDARQTVGRQPPTVVEEEIVPARAGETMRGIAGCPGVIEGRARVFLDPADARPLDPGEVLVAPVTDAAWTPLFLTAAAVVVDIGAVNSHAVIISRELGVPCVVSVPQASRRIPDGALIEVDGTHGTVRML